MTFGHFRTAAPAPAAPTAAPAPTEASAVPTAAPVEPTAAPAPAAAEAPKPATDKPKKIAFFVSDLSNVFHQSQATEAKRYAKEKYGAEVVVFDGKADRDYRADQYFEEVNTLFEDAD